MKKTKLLVAGALLATLALGGLVQEASAADTTGSVTLTEKNDDNKPVEPEDPGKEDPTEPGTGETGPLTVTVAPTFNFGSESIKQTGMTINDTATKSYLQVNDERSNLTNGWTVKAKRTVFSDSTQGGEQLQATLSIPKGVVRNGITTTAQGNTATTDPITNDSISAKAVDITTADTTVLTTATASANVGKGPTTSTLHEGSEKSKLTIGNGQAKTGTFTSTITWTVTAGANQ